VATSDEAEDYFKTALQKIYVLLNQVFEKHFSYASHSHNIETKKLT
jgi:hypothetical protein